MIWTVKVVVVVAANDTTRKMTNGAATVSYALFSNTGRTTNWGDTIGTDTVASTGTGASQSFTVFGRVAAQTTPAPNTYTVSGVLTARFDGRRWTR